MHAPLSVMHSYGYSGVPFRGRPYLTFKRSQETTINITEQNFNVVYNLWKNEVHFKETIEDEQDRINLFLVDLLNGTKYKKSIITDIIEHTLFDDVKVGQKEEDTDEPLIREGTNLSNYVMMKNGEIIDGFKYSVEEIAKLEGRKLMIVMNPPYQRRKGLKYDMAETNTGFSDGNNKKEKAK